MKLFMHMYKLTDSNGFLTREVAGGKRGKSCSEYIFLKIFPENCLAVIILCLE